MKMIGWSDGLTLRRVGGDGMLVGNCREADEIAACTSCAAASMLRSRSNCSVMLVEPAELLEVIELMPAMVENWFSSGVATPLAIDAGSGPGSFGDPEMVGTF